MGPLGWNLSDVDAGYGWILTQKEPGLNFPSPLVLNFKFVVQKLSLSAPKTSVLLDSIIVVLPIPPFVHGIRLDRLRIVQEFVIFTTKFLFFVLLHAGFVSTSSMLFALAFFGSFQNGTC